jgi:F-type H+-transporting ATPase subunit gamma
MQITSAMKMVSAAKLKRAQDAITQMRPYAEKLQEILGNVSETLDNSENQYSRQGEIKNVLLVVVSSNRGLAGAFNSNIIKKVNFLLREEYNDKNVQLMCIGKKANDYFKKTNITLFHPEKLGMLNEVFNGLNFEKVAPIAEEIMNAYREGKFDKVVVVYNQFKNAAVQITQNEQFLPVQNKSNEKKSDNNIDYIFEPDKNYIVQELIPKSLKIQLYKAVLDSNASEHGARMTAMHKATDNAKDMLRDLKIGYNKARQASITKELLEIVGGAEALNA